MCNFFLFLKKMKPFRGAVWSKLLPVVGQFSGSMASAGLFPCFMYFVS